MFAVLTLLLLQAPPPDLPIVGTVDSAVKGISGYNLKFQGKPASDTALMKRLYADLLGATPAEDEIQRFTEDPDPNKRGVLIDRLVQDERCNIHWANRFTQVLFGDPDKLQITGMPGVEAGTVRKFNLWLRGEFRKNMPWTDIVQRILAARGSLSTVPEAGYVLSFNRDAGPVVEFPQGVAKHFLGIRLYCAKCHDHPFDKWRMEDFYGLGSFITGQRATLEGGIPKILYIDGGDAAMPVIAGRKDTEVKFSTGGRVAPLFLYGGGVPAGADRMTTLATFMTQKENSQLPRAFVNRVWGWIFGHGIVDPVDDFSLKNKAVAIALMEGLVRDMKENDSSLKRLLRILCNTQAYQMVTKDESPDAYGYRQLMDSRFALGDYVEESRKVVLPIDLTIPETWKRVRRRTNNYPGATLLYRVPDPKDATRNAELGVFQKGSIAQSLPVDAQYVRPKKSSADLAGKISTTVQDLRGTWTCKPGADGPVEWAVLTATLETPKGPVGFRLEGPPSTVDAVRGDFETLLNTANVP